MAMRHQQLSVPLNRICQRWSGLSPTMASAAEPSQESTGRGKRRPQRAKESPALGLSGSGHGRKRKFIQGKQVGSRVKFAGKGLQISRIQIVGFATLCQLSIAEDAVSDFQSAGIVATGPRTLRVIAGNVAPDQQIIAPPVAPEI